SIMRSLSYFGLLTLVGLTACNLKQLALRNLADAASTPGTTYARDDDPELVRDAVPTMIKLQETILDGVPTHKGLLENLCRTSTGYSVAYLVDDADRLNEKDVARARKVYARAKRLFLRAREYCLRGLEVAHPGMRAALLAPLRTDWE